MNEELYYVKSNITGGHYALCTDKSIKPFENPMSTYSKFPLLPSDIVCDIGAYVGEYSLYALRNKGVFKTYTYEPTPFTFEVLKRNKIDNMEIYQLAVTGDNRSTTDLYISSGIGVTNSIAKSNKHKKIEVNCIQYEKALRDATVVKIDVEGAEYSYNIVQPQLRGIILEFHPLAGKDWRSMANLIMLQIESSGYKCIIRPSFKSGWSLTGCWIKI